MGRRHHYDEHCHRYRYRHCCPCRPCHRYHHYHHTSTITVFKFERRPYPLSRTWKMFLVSRLKTVNPSESEERSHQALLLASTHGTQQQRPACQPNHPRTPSVVAGGLAGFPPLRSPALGTTASLSGRKPHVCEICETVQPERVKVP